MASIEDIANIALSEVGSKPIADINAADDGPRAAKARIYTCADQVARMHPWNCLIRRATLPLAGVPASTTQWANAFNLPTDPFCLRLLRVGDNDYRDIKFKVEGRQILTNEAAPLPIRFIARISDVALWDPLYGLAVGLHTAHSIAYRLTQDRNTEKELRNKFIEFLREARSANGQEGTEDPIEIGDGDFLSSRN